MRRAGINDGHRFSNVGYSQELNLEVNCYNYVYFKQMAALVVWQIVQTQGSSYNYGPHQCVCNVNRATPAA